MRSSSAPMGPTGGPAGYNNGNGGLWNSNNPSYPPGTGLPQPGAQHPSSSAYPTRNLGYSQQQPQQRNGPGLGSSLGFGGSGMMQQQQQQQRQQTQQTQQQLPPQQQQQLPLGSGLPFNATASTTLPKPDDSRMIDSLFGTATAAAGGIGSKTDAGTGGLLSGLNSLSLAGNSGVGVGGGGGGTAAAPSSDGATGLWGPSSLTDSWTPNGQPTTAGGARGGGAPPVPASSIGDIFSGPIPSLSSQDQPQESRFNWNASANK